MLTLLVFILILGLLVFIHELGHFVVAKRLGVKVEEFGFGLPPRVFGKKIGETIYSLNLLPIGGFVKLYGEDEEEEVGAKKEKKADLKRAFFAKTKWQRTAIICAGVLMNFLLAVAVISYMFSRGVMVPQDKVRIVEVVRDSPAEKAGLKRDDVVLSIDGLAPKKSEELIKYTSEHLDQEVKLKIEREGQILEISLVPRKEYPKDQGPMGVAISSFEEKKYPIWQAPFVGTWESLKMSGMIVAAVGKLLWQAITQGTVPKEVAGPVGIAQITGEAVRFGPLAVWQLIGLLSLNLAVINILPIPALDGGRLLFIGIEAVTRKKVRAKFERITHQIGMLLLFILIILITYHDILRILSTTTFGAKIKNLFY